MRNLLIISILLTCLASSHAGSQPGLPDRSWPDRSLLDHRQNVPLRSFAVRTLDGPVMARPESLAQPAWIAAGRRTLLAWVGDDLWLTAKSGGGSASAFSFTALMAQVPGCDDIEPIAALFDPRTGELSAVAVDGDRHVCAVAINEDAALPDAAQPDKAWRATRSPLRGDLAALVRQARSAMSVPPFPSSSPLAWTRDPNGVHDWLLTGRSGQPLRFVKLLAGTTVFVDGFESGDVGAWSDVSGVNQPPILDPIGAQSVTVGGALTLVLRASDPDEQPIHFGASPLPVPVGAALDAVSGLFTFSPGLEDVGTVVLTFSASDGIAIDTEVVTITVIGPSTGAPTAIAGQILDADDYALGITTPIVGATVRLLNDLRSALSAADGSFLLDDLPSGSQVLEIDTTTAALAPNGAPYASFREALTLLPEVTHGIERPFFLPRIAVESLTTVDPATTTVIENPTLGVTLTVPPHTAKNPDGTDFTGQLSISLVPRGLAPVALPETLGPSFLLTIQPVGVRFTQPVPLTVPNVDGLSAASETDIWSLDEASGSFGIVGVGTVRADASAIDTTAGGIVTASWHALLPPRLDQDLRDQNYENHDPDLCDDCASGSMTALSSGNLTVTHDLVSYRSNDQIRGLHLVYTSETADPRPVVSSRTTIEQRSAVPGSVSARLEIGGIDQGAATFTNTSGLSEGADTVIRLAAQGRAGNFATGLLPYRLMLTSHFGQTSIAAIQAGNVFIHNRRSSPLGVGWGIDGLQRIRPIPGTPGLLVTNGNGGIQRFVPTANGPGTTLLADSFDDENGGDGVGRYASFNHWNVTDGDGAPPAVLLAGNGFQDAWPGNGLYVGMDVDPGGIERARLESKTNYVFSLGTYEIRLRVATPISSDRDHEVFVGLGGPAHPFDTGDLFAATFAPAEVSAFQEISCLIEVVPAPATQDVPVIMSGITPGTGGGCVVQIAPVTAPLSLRKPLGTDGVPIGGLYIDDVELVSFGNVSTAFAGPAGDTSTIVLDDATGTLTRIEKDGSRRRFDLAGRQSAWVARNGQTTTYSYDGEDRLSAITDPTGRVTSFTYDSGLLTEVIDPAGRTTHFTHDPERNLASITDPDGSVRAFRYDLDHRLIEQTSPRGFKTDYFYNFAGQNVRAVRPDGSERRIEPLAALALGDLASGMGTVASPLSVVRIENAFAAFIDGRGNITRFTTNRFGSIGERIDALGNLSITEYSPNGRPTSITSPEGIVTEFDYDARLNMTRVREAVGTAIARESELIYEPNLNLVVRATDPSGARATYAYDPATGNLETAINAEGHQRTLTWDLAGRIETVTDERGNVTVLGYDALGNLQEIEDATGRVTRLDRDAAGNVTSITEAFGTPEARVWARTYDARNRLTSTTDPAGQTTTSYGYDAAGNTTAITRPSGLVTSATYDAENRVATLSTPQAGTVTFTYDAAGNLESATDAQGHTTTYIYDPLDRLVQTIDPLGGISTTVYDDDGRVQTFENARGQITSFVFDELGRLRSRANPLLESVTLTYDEPRDLVQTFTDAEGQLISHVYDALGRRTSTSTTTATGDDTITFAFDPTGNLTRIADNDSENVYTYDALNRVATETTTLVGGTPVVLTHAYDPRYGNRETLTDSLGGSTLFGFDDVNRVNSVTSASGPQVGLTWDGDGRLAGIQYPNGISSTYAYDPSSGLLDTLTFADTASTLLEAAYTFDASGRIDTIVEGGQTRTFAYDPLGRVTGAGTSGLPESYAYDAIGNRTFSHLSASYAHDDADRLLTEASHTYTYDKNGNLRTKTETATGDLTTYTYDGLNRLVGVALPGGGSATYRYDALGRRFEKNVDGTVTRYLYDGSDILLEQDGAESVTARYAHGALVDQPLAMTRGGTDAFYLADHQGSIRFLLDNAGTTLNQYTYDAFGRSLVATEAIANPYTYTAREQDPETGHLHYRARAYDPNIGRFLAQDPIGFAGGDANLYAYVGNDPANFSDPSGLFTPWDALDIVSFFFSLNDFRNCPGIGTGFLVIADFAGAALPLLPAWGTLRHAINAVDGVVDIANNADNLADGARGVSNLAGGVPRGAVQTIEQRAADLVTRNGGKNRVSVVTPDGRVNIDLQGRPHGGVETPHVATFQNNIIPSGPRAGQVGSRSQVGPVRPATNADLRIVDRLLNSRGQR